MSVDSPALEDQFARPQERGTPRQFVAYAATIAVCLIAGAFSWLNVKPGVSLLWPMAVDVIIFAFFGALCRLVSTLLDLCWTGHHKPALDVLRRTAGQCRPRLGERKRRSSCGCPGGAGMPAGEARFHRTAPISVQDLYRSHPESLQSRVRYPEPESGLRVR
jgi:hypothetical protein